MQFLRKTVPQKLPVTVRRDDEPVLALQGVQELPVQGRRGAPEVAKVIKMHQRWPEIVEWYLSDDPLPEVKSNADRGGYFLYQKKDGRFMF